MSNNRNLGDFADHTGSANQPSLNLPNIGEITTTVASAPPSTINYDVLTQSVLNYSVNTTANFTVNVRGSSTVTFASFLPVGEAVDIRLMVSNGGTAYYLTALTIDGNAQTIKWAGGTAPSAGTANAVDVYNFTIIQTSSGTYTVFGQFAVSGGVSGGGGMNLLQTLILNNTSSTASLTGLSGYDTYFVNYNITSSSGAFLGYQVGYGSTPTYATSYDNALVIAQGSSPSTYIVNFGQGGGTISRTNGSTNVSSFWGTFYLYGCSTGNIKTQNNGCFGAGSCFGGTSAVLGGSLTTLNIAATGNLSGSVSIYGISQ